MRILVDALPDNIDECIFSMEIETVSDEAYEDAEVCEECGGLLIDDDDIEIVYGCQLTGGSCSLDMDGECDMLSVGYVTKF